MRETNKCDAVMRERIRDHYLHNPQHSKAEIARLFNVHRARVTEAVGKGNPPRLVDKSRMGENA